ncbi:adenylate kinase [Mycoplasmatota bacterium WC44]
MNLLIMGPPGSGKGTQSKLISEKYDVPHISTGDMFRTAMREQTKVGKLAQKYIDRGMYVPDEVTIKLVEERLQEEDCKKGFLLDGFPRTIYQAEKLDELMENMGKKIDHMFKIEVDSYVIVKRLSGRRICPKCESSFHLEFNPPKVKGVCDKCGSELTVRSDDTTETAIKRLEVYLKNTYPLIEYYEDKNLLRNIYGLGTIDRVFFRINREIAKYDNN